MQMEQALTLIRRLIMTGHTHQDYDRTVQLATDYRTFITGADMDKKLRRVIRREDEEMFQQRIRLTQAVTPAVASSLAQPFNKVVRNDRIRKTLTMHNEGRQKAVENMIKSFYGSSKKNNKGLNYWLKTRFKELQFMDPNSWVIIEWETPTDPAQVVKPKPFEVSAAQVKNFLVVNEEIKWVFIQQPIKLTALDGTTPADDKKPETTIPGYILPAVVNGRTVEGFRYTLYDSDVTIQIEQINLEYLKAQGYILQGNETLIKVKDVDFILRTYTPKIGFPPVIRIGYKRDDLTKGRTFVNPWHDALCYFEKSLKTVSELDLTMAMHAFPQKLQYVEKCQGVSRNKKCNNGYIADGSVCEACHGSGYKIINSTTQDAIILPMPDDASNMIKLEDILTYKSPPIDLIKFQHDYVQYLEKQCHQTVYNSQALVTKPGQDPQKTATEADYNFEAIYDTLEPFTEKTSEVYIDIVTIMALITSEPLEQIEVSHDFPNDFKLKTNGVLLTERKSATDSGAPSFLVQTIDEDLAANIYAGDREGMNKYLVKQKFYPFPGRTEQETVDLVTSEFVPKYPKVLFMNFDVIFREIEQEKPEFYTKLNLVQQQAIVKAKVEEYIALLATEKPAVTLNQLGDTNPLNAGNTITDPKSNPGSNNPSNDTNGALPGGQK